MLRNTNRYTNRLNWKQLSIDLHHVRRQSCRFIGYANILDMKITFNLMIIDN